MYTPSFIKEAKRTLGRVFKRGDEVQDLYIDFLLQLSSFKLRGNADLNEVLNRCKGDAHHPSSLFTNTAKGLGPSHVLQGKSGIRCSQDYPKKTKC